MTENGNFYGKLTHPVFKWINQNLLSILSLFIIVPAGFASKFHSGFGEDWINNSLGGILYEIFWCLIIAILMPKGKISIIAIGVFLTTCALECLQLWHPPMLTVIRSHFIGRTLLGTTFVASDFVYYAIGSIIGWYWMKKLNQINLNRNQKI